MFRFISIIFALFILTACTEQIKIDVSGVGEIDATGPSALAWDGKNLIVGKEGLIVFLENIDTAATGSIYNYEGHYFFDRHPISITSKEKSPFITGLAWQKATVDTGYLWVADGSNRKILKVTQRGNIMREIKLKIYPEDITFDGENLWVADSKRKRILKLSSIDGSTLAEYLSPVTIPTALAWDGRYLIIAGIKDEKFLKNSSENVEILKLDPESGKIVATVLIPKHFAQHLKELSMPTAMVWINDKILVGDRNSGRIIILSDWTEVSEDNKNYKLTTATPSMIKIKIEEKSKAQEVDEAKKAAEEARKAAEEAKKAAEAAKKAFELQQKK